MIIVNLIFVIMRDFKRALIELTKKFFDIFFPNKLMKRMLKNFSTLKKRFIL